MGGVDKGGERRQLVIFIIKQQRVTRYLRGFLSIQNMSCLLCLSRYVRFCINWVNYLAVIAFFAAIDRGVCKVSHGDIMTTSLR